MASLLENLQKIAMLSAADPDDTAHLRRIFRWFSKNFHTPLSEVEDLPVEYVLLHYFEDMYEKLEPEERTKQITYLLETPEERKAREAKEVDEEDNYMRVLQAELEEAKKKREFEVRNNAPLITGQAIEHKPLKPAEPVEPDIAIEYVDEIDLDEMD